MEPRQYFNRKKGEWNSGDDRYNSTHPYVENWLECEVDGYCAGHDDPGNCTTYAMNLSNGMLVSHVEGGMAFVPGLHYSVFAREFWPLENLNYNDPRRNPEGCKY